MRKLKLLMGGILAFVPIMALVSAPVSAATTTKIVTPSDMATGFPDVLADPTKWFFYNDENDTINNSLGSFVLGPSTPPEGNGSVQISVSGTQRRNLATYQFAGTKLSDITELRFSTYNPSAGNGGSASRSGYLNFNVTFDGVDSWQRRLVFLPTDNGSVVQNSWQSWDAVNGGNAMYRYSGATWPTTVIPGTTPRSLSDLISSYPNLAIRTTDSWLGVRVGEPYADGYTENIDKFVFGTSTQTTTFDFEPFPRAEFATKDNCKNGGWQNFDGLFKNQGACVSTLVSDKPMANTTNYPLNSNNENGVNVTTEDGKWYRFRVTGTWTNRAGEVVDAECTSWQGGSWLNEVNGGYSPDLLDVQIDKQFVSWGECDPVSHKYSIYVKGTGGPVNVRVFDGDTNTNQQISGWFGDNVGTLNLSVTKL